MSDIDNDDKTPIIPEQGAIYVYTNDADAVVISQPDESRNEEHFVYVHRHNLPKLIEKLQSYLPPKA